MMAKIEIEEIGSVEQLDALLQAAESEPVWILKHSLICPLSRLAWESFETFVAAQGVGPEARFAFIPIQRARPVSAALSERTGLKHESPQVLFLHQGEVVWHASHLDISEQSLAAAARSMPTATA